MQKASKEPDLRRRKYLKEVIAKENGDLRVCVLGAGHGGLAMAGHIGLMGFQVSLYNRSRKKLRPVIARKGIKVEGEVQGFGKIDLISNRIEDCIKGVDILMVAVPAKSSRTACS